MDHGDSVSFHYDRRRMVPDATEMLVFPKGLRAAQSLATMKHIIALMSSG